MKCTCESCNGTGRVRCEDCDGDGERESSLLSLKIHDYERGYETVKECKAAAVQVSRQAEMLAEIFPARRNTYVAQMQEILKELEEEAEQAMSGKRKT